MPSLIFADAVRTSAGDEDLLIADDDCQILEVHTEVNINVECLAPPSPPPPPPP